MLTQSHEVTKRRGTHDCLVLQRFCFPHECISVCEHMRESQNGTPLTGQHWNGTIPRVHTRSESLRSDPDRMGGTLVFRGSRVPAQAILDYTDDGYSLAEFLEMFPSVQRDDAEEFLRLARGPIHDDRLDENLPKPLKGIFAGRKLAILELPTNRLPQLERGRARPIEKKKPRPDLQARRVRTMPESGELEALVF